MGGREGKKEGRKKMEGGRERRKRATQFILRCFRKLSHSLFSSEGKKTTELLKGEKKFIFYENWRPKWYSNFVIEKCDSV